MSQQDAFDLTFDFLADRKMFVQQDDMPLTSGAGLLPTRQFDQLLGFTRCFAECLNDSRSDAVHSIVSMVRQRLFGVLAGYEDCNDQDRLRDDPVFELVARDRYLDDALAAQPSLCRFQNSIDSAAL